MNEKTTSNSIYPEKDALVGIVGGICSELDVPFFSCRGYTSSSEMWVSAQRIIKAGDGRDAKSIILHLGDHDPSGIDMTRDIKDRMEMFKAYVDVIRIGLTMDQIEQYTPPPNPTKLSDSRATKYIDEHGYSCWELDALEPRVIEDLIRTFVSEYTDPMKVHNKLNRLDREKEELTMLTEGYEDAIMFLKELNQR